MMESIKKIVEKPIEIKRETVNVNYSVSRAEGDELLISQQKAANDSTSARKKSYLEEYDESKRKER